MNDHSKTKSELINELQILRKQLEKYNFPDTITDYVESKLQESEIKYHTLFESANDAIFLMKGDLFIDCNTQTLMMFGCKRDEIIGHSPIKFSPLLQPDGRTSNEKAVEKISAVLDGKPQIFEWKHKQLNGSLFDAEVSLNLVKLSSGSFIQAVVRNITKRKLAESALLESENKNRTYFENAPEGIFVADSNGKYIDVNETACKMTLYSRDELLNMSISDLVKPESLSKSLNSFQRLQDKGKSKGESILTLKDKTEIYVSISASSLSNNRFMAFCLDISDRKKIELDLIESKRMLGDVLDNIPVRVFWKDLNSVFLGCNQLFAEDAGKKNPDEIIGNDDYNMAWFDEADMYRQDDKLVIESNQAKINYEEPQTTPEGKTIWLKTSKIPLKNTSGDVYGVLGLYNDITHRKLAEQELHQLRNYLSNIIDSMPSVLIGVDIDCVITQWNHEAYQKTGITVEKAIGKPLKKVLPHFSKELTKLHRAMQTQKVQTDSRRKRRVNNETRYEDITIYPLTANGMRGAVIRVDDVTERVMLDEMMIQSEKMLLVGGLAAGMAHEINNPIAGILQTADVMNNRLINLSLPANKKAADSSGVSLEAIASYMDDREVPRMLSTIHQLGKRVADIVHNMLNFARKSEHIKNTFDIENVINSTLKLAATDYDLKKQFDFKIITIIKEYEKNLPLMVGDDAMIQQVLLNILRNGAEAMHDMKQKNPIFKIRIQTETKQNFIRIEIEDNGPGMTEDIRKQVFEPFFTTKSAGVGTGLGLSVSFYIITENFGGKMTVISNPDKGANFVIRLPFDKTDR
ncbi:MAG: PAS domain S-box protein [Candidatus Marinimicrobia bacterium]|jgi:PAS domain S-box-containing protein|nr:PAS domain S-box protein [Candidatus Neomarinimicrobiota bacterium]MBT3633525.1 PAS domain S-box protein [Candidatus Neomarinimicrobiota bacterium]MBT3681667.1 PAS domain S-box protein [Candidatus Neomarinimicrobiota bacterium]MBT3758365.1 PAS domain S-box protein [Candidatus Neomarinimicrobiota bacterium]MBT3894981.1 PAS domain S-box protein [Candidatus Neomarinimicrobiota bacterium]